LIDYASLSAIHILVPFDIEMSSSAPKFTLFATKPDRKESLLADHAYFGFFSKRLFGRPVRIAAEGRRGGIVSSERRIQGAQVAGNPCHDLRQHHATKIADACGEVYLPTSLLPSLFFFDCNVVLGICNAVSFLPGEVTLRVQTRGHVALF
jgi:hypothetical protein